MQPNVAPSPYGKKGLTVRLAYLAVALARYAQLAIFGVKQRRVVVLCYHAVTQLQAACFSRQMNHISGRAVAIDQIGGAPDGAVVVTFDDAFEGLLSYAIPATQRLNIPAAIFAVTGCLGRPPGWLAGTGHPEEMLPTMTADQVRRLAGEPLCTVGSHTVTHRRLGELATSEVATELVESRKCLEELTRPPCDYIALPHGSWSPETLELAAQVGYRSVLTLQEIAFPDRWPKGTIGRFTVSPDMWMIEFKLTTAGAYDWLYSWRLVMRRLRNAVRPGKPVSC